MRETLELMVDTTSECVMVHVLAVTHLVSEQLWLQAGLWNHSLGRGSGEQL